MPGMMECGPCDIAPAITFGRRERRRGCGPRCSGYDCGHSHVDASAPGLLRGVAAPLLRWLLASSLVAAAAATVAIEPARAAGGDGGGVGPVVLLACAVPSLLLLVVLLRTWWIVPQVHADTSGLAGAATLARCLAKQDEYAERLGAALRCRTISHDDDDPDHDPATFGAETRKLHALLRAQFPLVHAHLKLTVVNQLSLVYEWVGEDETLPPYAGLYFITRTPTRPRPRSRSRSRTPNSNPNPTPNLDPNPNPKPNRNPNPNPNPYPSTSPDPHPHPNPNPNPNPSPSPSPNPNPNPNPNPSPSPSPNLEHHSGTKAQPAAQLHHHLQS